MSSEILYEKDFLRVEYFPSPVAEVMGLCIIFSPSLNRKMDGNGFGGDVFLRNGFDTIAFKNSKDDWFQSVPLDVFSKINQLVEEKKYSYKCAYGSSMGGYASLAFSKLLKLDSAILFSPQYSIDESFDTRWSSYSNEIEFVYRIDRNSVGENCKFYIFYDNKDIDSLQVDRLIDVIDPGNIELFKIPFSGHPVAHYLSEVSLNKNLIEFFIKNLRIDRVDFLKGRRLSKSYFQNIAQFLYRKGKFKSALAMIDRAIFIDPEKANFYLIKSDVLEKMGRLDDALSYINKALSIDATNKHYLFRFGKIEEKKRLIESEKVSADAG